MSYYTNLILRTFYGRSTALHMNMGTDVFAYETEFQCLVPQFTWRNTEQALSAWPAFAIRLRAAMHSEAYVR